MIESFAAKTVIVTGASSGIGAATARLFAKEGARVVLTARRAEKLQAVAASIGAADRTLTIPTDITDPEACRHLLEAVCQRFSAVHILINCAGVLNPGPVELLSPEALTRVIDVNLKAPILLSRLTLPFLRKAGGGAIVNVASIAGQVPVADEAVYTATKFGLRGFAFALAEELKGSGITVSTVSPGPVSTAMVLSEIDEVPDLVFSQPMRTPEQIAGLIVRCARDGCRERTTPRLSGWLAKLACLFPGITRPLMPLLQRKGRRKKQQLKSYSKPQH